MPLLARTVNTPVVVEIGAGVGEHLRETLAKSRISPGGAVAVVLGRGLGPRLAPLVERAFPGTDPIVVGASTVAEARRLETALRGRALDAVVALGGGGTLDVTKWAATMLGLPFVAVATNLAHDGLASPVAVLEYEGRRQSFGVHMPLGVVVDLDWVTGSPVTQLRSGVGDVVSNLGAVADWHLAATEQGNGVDGLAVALAQDAAEAVLHHPDSLASIPFLTTLAHSLVLSGMAMSVAGSSRPCSGGCHEISHAIDALFPGTALHGAQVAVGAMFTAHLRASPFLAAVDACFRRHGVARVPADLGLDAEEFTRAVLEAPATRPERFTILEHRALTPAEAREEVDAFVDAFGR